MVRTLIALILSYALLAAAPAQAEIKLGSATFPESITLDGTPLHLNGAGIRSKVIFHVYAMGLYLPQPVTQAEAALTSPRHARSAFNFCATFLAPRSRTR
ncbi:chalcone isomerase family protein [Hydrogenophilus hirschii]